MRTTAIKVFLGTLLAGILPISAVAETKQPKAIASGKQQFEFFAIQEFADHSEGDRLLYLLPLHSLSPLEPSLEFTSLPHFTIELPDNYLQANNPTSYEVTPITPAFKAGLASWQGKNQFGSVQFDGNFDTAAHFTKGKASLSSQTALGLVNLSISLNNQIKPIKAVTGWQTNTPLGSFAVKGNFNEEIAFIGGNAAWNAKTAVGVITVKGNFDQETNF
ncbi:MAG: hypothetical protein AAFQ14_09940, partial [Cyanobacteria bacterium J06621_12]